MKHAVVLKNQNTLSQAGTAAKAVFRLIPLAMVVSACGGGDGSSSAPAPVLQVGMQREYTGTTTRNVVYANPSTTQQNSTLEYSFVENQSVLQAAAGAPGDFDVQSGFTYTLVTDPGVGMVPTSQTVDTYENLLVSGNSQQVVTLGQNVVAVSNDETANALGTGPYTATSTTNSTYTTPRDNFPYPLQTGAQMTVPQSEAQTIAFSDLNAGGMPPSDGSEVGYSQTRTENDDGSFSYDIEYVNGKTSSRTQDADGSGSQSSSTGTSASTTTVGLPVSDTGVNTIPIAVTAGSTTTNYSAADWYPANGAPNSPLVLATRNVVGPTATLPSDCSGATLRPNIYEVDTSTTSLNTIAASYSTTTTRNFIAADGASVCQLTTEIASNYDLRTGELVSTTTTTSTSLLSTINY